MSASRPDEHQVYLGALHDWPVDGPPTMKATADWANKHAGPMLDALERLIDENQRLRERLIKADGLFKSLGQCGHILDRVLDVMCEGREVCGGVSVRIEGQTLFVENPPKEPSNGR